MDFQAVPICLHMLAALSTLNVLYPELHKAAKLGSPLHMQEHEEKGQLKMRLEAIAADVSAARSETTALRAWKKTAAEQALSYEAQVRHQGLTPQIVNSAILPLL